MPTKNAGQKVSGEERGDFAATFKALREILTPYTSKDARVVHDKLGYYYLETTFSVMGRGPLMFASVRKGKGYVSYHLLPLYMNRALQSKVSADLKRRKQGIACFNFAKPDEKLFAEVAKITRLGWEAFKKMS